MAAASGRHVARLLFQSASSLPIPGALTEPVVCNCMRADYSFRRDLSVLPA